MIDPLYAVTNQNVDELRCALIAGWNPPRIISKNSGTVPDFSIWTETVMRDWVDGFKLLDEFLPTITRRVEIWDVALRNASVGCIEVLWDHMGFKFETLSEKILTEWTIDVMAGMGEPWSPAHEVKDVIPLIKFLKSKNINLLGVFPGDFAYGDLRMAGHSLWTRSIHLKRWDLVYEFWPSNNVWMNWPRTNEVLSYLLNIIVGDSYPLIAEHYITQSPEEDIFFLWLEKFALLWMGLEDSASNGSSITQECVNIEDPNYVPVYRILARPSQDRIAPWLRLPLSILSQHRSNLLWNIWEQVLMRDQDFTWLHELAMYPEDKDVQRIIEKAKNDHAIAFYKYWTTPQIPEVSLLKNQSGDTSQLDFEKNKGFSSHDRLVNFGGDIQLVLPFLPSKINDQSVY